MSSTTVKIFRSNKKLDENNIWNKKINEHLSRHKSPYMGVSLPISKVNIIDRISLKELLNQLRQNTNFVRSD